MALLEKCIVRQTRGFIRKIYSSPDVWFY